MGAEYVGHDSRNLAVAMLLIWILLGLVACLLWNATIGKWSREAGERIAKGEACLRRADSFRELHGRDPVINGELVLYAECADWWETRAREKYGMERVRRAHQHRGEFPPVTIQTKKPWRPWQA